MEQRLFFRFRTDIRDEPTGLELTQPCHDAFLTAHFSIVLWDTILKLLNDIVTGLRIVVWNFHREFLISSKVIVIFCENGFSLFVHTFFAYNSWTTKYFQSLIISCERTFEDLSESLYVFISKISFIKCKIDFLVKSTDSQLTFFSEHWARTGFSWMIHAVWSWI